MSSLSLLLEPIVLGPLVIFIAVFGLTMIVGQRQSAVAVRLARYGAGSSAMASPAPSLADVWRARMRRPSLPARLSTLLVSEKRRAQTRTLLNRAGSPMTLEAYGRLSQIVTFVLTPVLAALAVFGLGDSMFGLGAAAVVLLAVPRLPTIALKRLARRRAAAMDAVISDVLDLLVVCVEGGQSLSAALMQVSQRMDNVAAEEFGRLLADINTGMSRRDAFTALADRCQSDALSIATTTIIHADKVGMSLAHTLRTLSDMMRTRRRQAAETRARQAPIKMMPVLVGFMLPAMLALLLGPVALEAMSVFR